jgi:CotS family spore coat protein
VNDRAIGLLEQYDIELQHTRKGRGAIICDTAQGCLIFKEYTGNVEKLTLQNLILKGILDRSGLSVERILPTKEDLLYVKDTDGITYILKTYVVGRECNINDYSECINAVKMLAKLHKMMEFTGEPFQSVPLCSQQKEYEKHNRELKHVRKFLRQRSQKTAFEIRMQDSYDYFYEQAQQIAEEWDRIPVTDGIEPAGCTFCHGDYQYHNILKIDNEWFIINFEKCLRDNPVRDLNLLLRKLLEKNNWSVSLGEELLKAYERERSLSEMSRLNLYYRLAYPEKFWKIVNFYFNSPKAWIPGRNMEKLEKLISQEEAKQTFLRTVFPERKG